MRHRSELRICFAATAQPVQRAPCQNFLGGPRGQWVPVAPVVLSWVPFGFFVLLGQCIAHQLGAGLKRDFSVDAVVGSRHLGDRVQQQRVGQVDSFHS